MSRHGDRRQALERVGSHVVARRNALGLSQEALADAASVDPKTIGSLEAGRRWPIAKNRAKIETALGWPLGELERLLNGEEPSARSRQGAALLEAAVEGGGDFDALAREIIADLPEPQRSVMEELYQSKVEAERRNQRLLDKLLRAEVGADDPDVDQAPTR